VSMSAKVSWFEHFKKIRAKPWNFIAEINLEVKIVCVNQKVESLVHCSRNVQCLIHRSQSIITVPRPESLLL